MRSVWTKLSQTKIKIPLSVEGNSLNQLRSRSIYCEFNLNLHRFNLKSSEPTSRKRQRRQRVIKLKFFISWFYTFLKISVSHGVASLPWSLIFFICRKTWTMYEVIHLMKLTRTSSFTTKTMDFICKFYVFLILFVNPVTGVCVICDICWHEIPIVFT